MPSQGLHALSIAQLRDAYASGTATPVDVTEALFDAIGSDPVNAFCVLDKTAALAMAEASAQRHRHGALLGPLDGIPVSIKDLIDVAGYPTRRGSTATSDAPAPNDAPSVRRLREGGAVLFGKTTTSEFGWAANSESTATGITLHPTRLGKSPGGSSCGAAAQIGRRWGPLALGSDAGGSIRIPASFCGLVGFKPTFGAIPLGPQSAFAEFAHLTPLTRSVEDCRIAMDVLSFADPLDPYSMYPRGITARSSAHRTDATPQGNESRAAAGAAGQAPVLGYCIDIGPDAGLDPAIAAAVEAQVETLRTQGYRIEAFRFDWAALAIDFWNVWLSRIHESFVTLAVHIRAQFDPRLQACFDAGASLTADTLARSRVRLREASTELARAFSRIDLLLTPAASSGAFDIGKLCAQGHPKAAEIARTHNWPLASPYAFPFNLTQQPALALPLGTTADGLPFGLQVAGRKFHDDQVLAFGAQLESSRASSETPHA
ncbi:amidase [Pigmentiphaga litoralis]|uniref:amidase n=1 Tax=Pigmentiphaga litoralis TaxID=516702 RepID=UPI0016730D28|nr:amidase family protein [Pigmentiphaga litoralis]GGX24578.1 amidase [Pigmentiphaga litoralis]